MPTLSTLRHSNINSSPTMATVEDKGQVPDVNTFDSPRHPVGSDSVSEYQRPNSRDAVAPSLEGVPYTNPARLGGDEPTNVWYCANCGDGPIPNWNPSCVSCNATKSSCCLEKGIEVHVDSMHGSPQDGPAEVQWYCCNCGDGPMMDWNPVCSECGHQRDGYCKEETI